jgi:pyrroloquinoline quinone (PQQ) biosynthesis protein C
MLGRLVKASERLLGHPRIRDLYPEYLFMGHCVIRASVPLMEAARERARSMAAADPVAAELADYLSEHIDEERDHDEWLLDDLAAIGLDRSAILARPPSPTVANAVGAQYYWILHYHPVALLGWIGLLEGYPPTPAMIDRLTARTGYGPEAFRTLTAHAELDPHHGDELFETVDRLPLTPEQSAAIGLNAMSSVHVLAKALDEVVDRAPASPATRS